MEPIRVGADIRLLRRRKGWSQARLAVEADVSRWVVSQVECGRGDRFPSRTLRQIVDALGGYLSVRVLFRGEALDRLRDARHARLVELLVAMLLALGWVVETEVSFNHFGDRGSVDLLAFHPAFGTLLVIEVKTVVPDVGGMLMTLDKKVRVAGTLAAERGWAVITISRLLVLPEDRTARRRVTDHAVTFDNAFPTRNEAVRRWLRAPSTAMRGLFFLTDAARASSRHKADGEKA